MAAVLDDSMTILAIETSCDETAAAVVRGGTQLIANVVASQIDEHRRYGGVVPEVASRQHILAMNAVVEEALHSLPGGWNDVQAVAATYGPGLSGALLTGLNTAKAMAWGRALPFIGVNHIEAHIYANWLGTGLEADKSAPPVFPLIALIVSGGHTMLVLLEGHGRYRLLGQTRDDAAGEAFDKVARIMGLGFPGGPAVQRAAEGVLPTMKLPRAWLRDSYDFSFSGLKTAVLHQVQARQELAAKAGTRIDERTTPDAFTLQLAHAFQESVVDVLVSKSVDAARAFGATEILLAGGVAANTRLRSEMQRRSAIPVRFPPITLCTDNAAMVAAAAYFRYEAGLQDGWDLEVDPNLALAS